MLGYAFMGKAHSNAFKKIAYITWPPPLEPRLVGIAGRNERGGRRGGDALRLRVRDDTTGASSSPTTASGSSTTAARTRCTPSRRSPRPRRASTWSARSRSGATRTRATRSGSRVAATGVKHLCAFNYRFVPAVRLAREMIDAGELGEIRHFRGRYLQDWGDDPSLDTWRFDPDAAGSGALGDLGTHVVDLARFLNGEIATVSGLREDVPGRAQGRRRGRGGGRVRERLRRHDRGDALRARPPQRVPVGDQRLEGLARVRHGAPERAAGLPRRRRPRARLQDGARLRDRPSVLGALVAARPHHRLGRHVRARAAPHARRRSRRTATSRRTARRSRTAIARPRCATRSCAPGRAAARDAVLPLALSEHERRLAAAVGERLLEAVERHAQPDERLERVRASARARGRVPRRRRASPAGAR